MELDMPQSTEGEFDPLGRAHPGDDYIVIPKIWVMAVGVGLVCLILGGLAGYGLAVLAMKSAVAANPNTGAVAVPQAAQPSAPPARIANVSADDDPFLGPADAPITIVEFSDYQCPFCKRFRDDTFDALFEQYGDQIRLVFRDFPLSSIHPDAQKASEAAECVREQNAAAYWEMHDLIFASQVTGIGLDVLKGFAEQLQLDTEQFNQCLDDGKYAAEVAADLRDGESYGVTGTPTFFINGVRLVGAQPLSAFQAVIDEELKN